MAEWASIDLETFGVVDLKKSGVYPYAQSPVGGVFCLCYRLDMDEWRSWVPGQPLPADLVDHIVAGGKLRAWNAAFERTLWTHVLTPRHGWPQPTLEQWYCTAAQAAAMALPRTLEQCAQVMGLDVQKDKEGAALMMRMCRPRKINPDGSIVWWDDEAKLARLIQYCGTDVMVESALAARLRPLDPFEREVYLQDQRINDRGVRLDLPLVHAGIKMAAASMDRLNEDLRQVTGGHVTKATKAADLTTWLRGQGVETDGVAKAAVRQMLAGDIEGAARQAVEIRAEAAKASTAKLTAMVKCACSDSRARGLHLVYGAGTGRWAGRLIQLQNLPRGSVKKADLAIPLIIDGDIDLVSMLFGPPLDVISSNLRGCLIPAEGCDFIQSDFSNIEGRITAWLAGEEWKIQAFRDFDAGTGRDLYLIGAEKILTLLGVPYAHPLNENSTERTPYGKVPELALGFGGGVGAFQSMAAIYGMKVTDEEADQIKVAWREAHPRVVALWRNMEDAAFNAISNPGRVVSTAGGRIKYVVKGGFLWMVLPSGRPLAYAHPRIEKRRPAWNIGQDEIKLKDTITFMAVNSITRKWERCTTYGGSLAENCLAGDTEVLTPGGWVRLDSITSEPVWDGVEWVQHDGLAANGFQQTGTLWGARMTGDHRVLTEKGWKYASQVTQSDRPAVREANRHGVRVLPQWKDALERAVRLWRRENGRRYGNVEGPHPELRVSSAIEGRGDTQHPWDVAAPRIRRMAEHGGPLHAPDAPRLAQLWRAGNNGLRRVAAKLRRLLGGHGADILAWADAGSCGQQRRLLRGQLPVGGSENSGAEYSVQPHGGHPLRQDAAYRSRIEKRNRPDDVALPGDARMGGQSAFRPTGRSEPVFDLLNAGPRHRFLVRGRDGVEFIAHNCIQAIARDLLANALLKLEAAGYPVVIHVHDEALAEVRKGVGSVDEFKSIMCDTPAWAAGLPVAAAGWRGSRYRK